MELVLEMTKAKSWKLRRVAADSRQQDIALRMGISTSRYSAIEREEQEPTELEIRLIEQFLPQLPVVVTGPARTGARQAHAVAAAGE
jgi:transcriptional regulator with XRE-family HTH domain